MKKIGSVLKAVSKGFSVISFVGLFVGVIFVVVDVVLRYFFDSPSMATTTSLSSG